MSETAWFNDNILPTAMLNSGFKPLNQSDHFTALDKSLKMSKGKTLLDLGCGIAEVGSTFTEFDYTGADLPHIIENAARVKNPNLNYAYFNANEDEYVFLNNYDIVLMNSFLSEIPDWFRVLSKVLMEAKDYVIIHRQEITSDSNFLQEYRTYGNLITPKTVLNYSDLTMLFERMGFKLLLEIDSFAYKNNQKTFLLQRHKE